MFIMISQFKGYLKLWNYFLMFMILTASVQSELQLCLDMSDPIWIFAGIILERLIQFHQSQRVVSNRLWQVNSLQMCIHHARRNRRYCWKTDEWSIFSFSITIPLLLLVQNNFEGCRYPNGVSLILHLNVWLLLDFIPATASVLNAFRTRGNVASTSTFGNPPRM